MAPQRTDNKRAEEQRTKRSLVEVKKTTPPGRTDTLGISRQVVLLYVVNTRCDGLKWTASMRSVSGLLIIETRGRGVARQNLDGLGWIL